MLIPRGWHWLFVAEVGWRRWGLGVEVSLGYWWPREWSLYLHVGPVLLGFGREEDLDKGYDIVPEPDLVRNQEATSA